MPALNRVPFGFNQLLQLQTKGENPNDVSNVVQPVIDYEKFLRTSLAFRTFAAPANLASASNGTWIATGLVPVPQGELWYVHSLHFRTNALAATTSDLAIGMQDTQIGGEAMFNQVRSTGGSSSHIITYTFPELFPAVPGVVFGLFQSFYGLAGPEPGIFYVHYYRYMPERTI